MSNVIAMPVPTLPKRRPTAAQMGRTNELGERAVPNLGKEYDGLYLRVTRRDDGELSRVYIFRYTRRDGTRTRLGLGEVGLPDAMEMAKRYRAIVNAGRDPAQAREDFEHTYQAVAELVLPSLVSHHTNAKHIADTHNHVRALYPRIGRLPVSEVRPRDVADALREVWKAQPVTAARIRGNAQKVFAYAIASDMRTDANPATNDLMVQLLGLPKHRAKHMESMPWADVPDFMRALKGQDAVSANAYRFLILTSKRNNEVLGLQWSELINNGATWHIPADRMKARREHFEPLSTQAQAIIADMQRFRFDGNPYVFPGQRSGRPFEGTALLQLRDRMGYCKSFTSHGFRSSFKEWSRVNAVPALASLGVTQRELTELSLAHLVGSAVERAYGRDMLAEERRPLMQAWADYLAG